MYAYVSIYTHAYLTVLACVSSRGYLSCVVSWPGFAYRVLQVKLSWAWPKALWVLLRRICDERLESDSGARCLVRSVCLVRCVVVANVGQAVTFSSGLRLRGVSNVVILCSKGCLLCHVGGISLLGWDLSVRSEHSVCVCVWI